jgi:hypothetical protein
MHFKWEDLLALSMTAAIFCGIVSMSGCCFGTVYVSKVYKGPALPNSKIVILKGETVNGPSWSSHVTIHSIDGKELSNFLRGCPQEIRFLPGNHQFVYAYSLPLDHYDVPRRLNLTALPGHTYLIRIKELGEPFPVETCVEDTSTGEIVSPVEHIDGTYTLGAR